jgi:hypothetical protein
MELFWLLFFPFVAYAQELPLYTTPETFNYSVSHRQSVCDRHQAFHNGSVELRYTLAGLELRPWLPVGSFSSLDRITGAISNDTLPGLTVDILDELARRGQFTWRNSFGVSGVDDAVGQAGKNFDDILLWALETYDVAAAQFGKTIARIKEGASFPEGYYDSSIIMVGEQTNKKKLNFWSFLEPFEWRVWLMILVTFFISGAVYLWMEWFNEDSDRQELGNKPTETIYFATLTFFGDVKFQPSTDYARLFIAGLTFFSMLVASAYTANLASFLVVKNTPSLQIESVGDAARAGLPICVLSGTVGDLLVSQRYPGARLVRTDPILGEQGLFSAVLRGDCTVALTTVSTWDTFKGNSTLNPKCRLAWVGRVFKFSQGGFATFSDSGTLCTSLIRDVLNLHMIEMEEDGFLSSTLEKYQEASADIECDATGGGDFDRDDSSMQLSLQDLGGLFIVFYILAAVTMCMALFVNWNDKRRSKRSDQGAGGDTVMPGEHVAALGSEGGDAKLDNGKATRGLSSNDDVLAQLEKLQREFEAMRQIVLSSGSRQDGA